MSTLFRVIFEGQCVAGTTQQQVQEKLAALFKTDASKFTHWFAGNPITVKNDLPQEQANKYVAALLKAGAIALTQPQEKNTEPTIPSWDIADVGSDVLRPEERQETPPREVDTSTLRALDNSEISPIDDDSIPIAVPDLSHLDVMPPGDIDNLPDTRQPVSPDTSKLSLVKE